MTHSISDRRPSSSLSPSSPSTTSSDNPLSRPVLYRSRGRPPKRKRGRPRKDGSDLVRDNDVFYDMSVSDVVCSDSLRRRRGSPFNQEHLPSCKRSRNEVTPKKSNGVPKGEEEVHIGTSRKRTNCPPTNGITSPYKYATLDPQKPLSLADAAQTTDYTSNSHELDNLDPSLADPTHSVVGTSSSGTSLVDSETLVHSLRPRSSLLPPTQFRDELYDMNSDQSLRSSSTGNDPPTIATITSDVPLNSNNATMSSSETVRPVAVTTPSPLGTYKKSTSLIPVTISEDEKELLKAYLACLQTATTTIGPSPSKETVVQSEGGQQQPDERRFLDLLFSFMKMRRTPIHRVPRLGSRNCTLLALPHTHNNGPGNFFFCKSINFSSVLFS